MKEIKLTQGKVALVDDEDYTWLNQRKWTYAISGIIERAFRQNHNGHKWAGTVYMHREIMKAPSGMDVDHIDGNGLNNQKSNLRICTRGQNLCNKMKRPGTTSKYKGVCWDKRGFWEVSIKLERHHHFLGYFYDEREAARTYNKAALEYFGEFARLNVVD